MKSTLLTTFFLCLFYIASYAQNSHSIQGIVIDTASNVKLLNTTVSILRSKDSTLVKFTRANVNGAFVFTNLPKGDFILFVTYPGYADYIEQFTLDSTKNKLDFGRIKLFTKARLLADVIIKGKAAAIKIKGDTTEFNASSYTIQPNSKVEDLLKQLPGIQVDKDGKITAQGQKINKVLLDGEEFFGDDPTLVTKNIRADMVDKVQLYDKKSDQATFTGIDDGKKEKTINIKLKEDKKNGYFGKIDLGGGNDKYYQTQAMVNAFRGKKKFSAFGNLANTGKIGLGWQDNDKFGSSNYDFGDSGFASFSSSRDELEGFDGSYNGEGIPVARTGGAHYDAKWNNDKESINANYKIGSLNVNGVKSTISQNNLPTGIIGSNNDQSFDKYLFRQKADLMYQIKLDTTSTLKVSVDGTLKNAKNNSIYTGNSSSNGILLNESDRNLSNDTDDKLFNAKVLWTKKLKKTGRTLSLNLAQSISQSNSKGFLKSTNKFFNNTGGLDSTQVIDQYKTSDIKNSLFNSNLSYTEPLMKNLSLVINYGFGINNSSADRKSFNQSPDGSYGILDTLYSNNYELKQISNQGGVIFNYRGKKATLNIGTKVSNVSFDQLDVYKQVSFKRNFLNWNPQASYRYRFSQQKSINFDYSGNTSQPTIDQTQPVRINTDPLNISLGNPDLKTSFRSRFSVNYSSYKILSSKFLYVGGSYSFAINPIISNTVTDETGKSSYQFINLTGKTPANYNIFGQYSQKVSSFDINTGVDFNVSGSKSYSFINNTLNESQSRSYSFNFNTSKYKEKAYSTYLSLGPTYNTNESSLQKQTNDNGWGMNGNASFRIFLPGKFEIASDGNYEYRAKTKSFNEDFSRVIINSSISKSFLKSESLKLSLAVNDLLNKNVGFNRSSYGNMITQTNFTTIQRYFMATITWDFNKMGAASTKK